MPIGAARLGVSEPLEELDELDKMGRSVFVSHSAVEAAGDRVLARPGGGILGVW